MAMPYPEGEVFFNRSALKVPKSDKPDAWSFDPDNSLDFCSHVLIEFVWNRDGVHVGGTRKTRASAKIGSYTGYYADTFPVMFGRTDVPGKVPPNGNAPGVIVDVLYQIDMPTDPAAFRDRATGGPNKVALMPVPISKDARYMWIDLVVPIRAVYLPLAQKVDSAYPDLCTYVMIDFRYRRGANMMFTGGYVPPEAAQEIERKAVDLIAYNLHAQVDPIAAFKKFFPPGFANQSSGSSQTEVSSTHPEHYWQKFSYTDGLDFQARRTLQIDLQGVYSVLLVPRQMRDPEMGLYMPLDPKNTLIRNVSQDFTNTSYYDIKNTNRAWQLLDYSKVLSDHYGVDVTWQPYEYKEDTKSLVAHFFHLSIATGLCMIPAVGPLLSASYNVFIEAITDPDSFKKNNILQFDGNIMDGVAASALTIASMVVKKGKGIKMPEFKPPAKTGPST